MRLSSLSRTVPIAGMLVLPLAVAGAPASHAAERGHGSYGSASGVTADGLVNLPATPAVSSSGNRPVRRSIADLPSNPLVDASALRTSASAGHGRASVSDLRLSKAGLGAGLVTAKCVGGKGSAHLGKAVIHGRRLAANPGPNSALAIPIEGIGTASVVLNSQRRLPGGGMAVTAIEVNLPSAGGKRQRIGIASVTCNPKWHHGPHGPKGPKGPHGPDCELKGRDCEPEGPDREPESPKPSAPAPTPAPRDLPVTG